MSGVNAINGNGYYDWEKKACFILSDSSPNQSAKKIPGANDGQKSSKICDILEVAIPTKDAERPFSKKNPIPEQPDFKQLDINGDGHIHGRHEIARLIFSLQELPSRFINIDYKNAIGEIQKKRLTVWDPINSALLVRGYSIPIDFGKEVTEVVRHEITHNLAYLFDLIPQGILHKVIFGHEGPLKILIEIPENLPLLDRLETQGTNIGGYYRKNNIVVFPEMSESLLYEQSEFDLPQYFDNLLIGIVHELGHAIFRNAALRPSRWTDEIPIIGYIQYINRKDSENLFWGLLQLYPKPPSYLSYPEGTPNPSELFADSFSYLMFLRLHGKTIDYQKASATFARRSCGGAATLTLNLIERFLESDGDYTFYENLWRNK